MAKVDFKVIAIDLYPRMVETAKSYLTTSENILLSIAESTKLPLATGNLDAITAMSLIEHFTYEEAELDLLPEFHRVIRPQGYLFIHQPIRTVKTVFTRFWRKYIRRDLSIWSLDDDIDITHKMWITYNECISLIEDVGFTLKALDFQFTHSKTNRFNRQLAKVLDLVFTRITGEGPLSPSPNFRARISMFLKSAIATSCYILFQRN